MRILTIIETAYRGTIEEQDDTVVWTAHAMRKAGQDIAILLRGNAVCHATRSQDASGLVFGDWTQSNPVDLAGDLQKAMAAGIDVYVVKDDVGARGLEGSELIDGLKHIAEADIASLCDEFETVWHW